MDEEKKILRVCYFGTYRAKYTRNQIFLKGLRAQDGIEVYECHASLWQSIEDRVNQASGGWRRPSFIWRVIKTYWRLFRTHYRIPAYDIMLIGYPGQFDTYLARVLSWARRVPMALDILMSLHLVAEERGLIKKSPMTGRLIFLLEKGGLKLPDLLISENFAYEKYYCEKYNLSPNRFKRIPHGADDEIYYPRARQDSNRILQVTYHGMYLPSHGLDAIIGAARYFEPNEAHFHFYGNGPEKKHIEEVASNYRLGNVTFHGFVEHEELMDGLAQADICLGVFGETLQSHYTIQNKVWEGLAMRRTVVSGESDLINQVLTHRKNIFLVPRNDSAVLARAIRELMENSALREQLANKGYEFYKLNNSPFAIGTLIKNALVDVVNPSH